MKLLALSRFKFILITSIVFNFLFTQTRDCPENFSSNPQYPAISPECYPDNFVHYSSTNLAFYLFESASLNNFEISIVDAFGKLILKDKKKEFIGEFTKKVDLSTYPRGIYMIQIKTIDSFLTKRIVLQ